MSANPDPSASAKAAAKKTAKKKTPGQLAESNFDQAQLRTIQNCENIATSAEDPDYNSALITEGMSAGTPADLTTACADWRELSQQALDATGAKEDVTATGKGDATLIRQSVERIRSKCRLKITQNPTWSEPQKQLFRTRYFIGEDIFANEETAGQTIATMLERAATDTLPAISATDFTTCQSQLSAYTGKSGSQAQEQSDATKKRNLRDAKFTEVMNLRHEIQHAADDAFPWFDPLSQGPRTLFKLPAGRPFTG